MTNEQRLQATHIDIIRNEKFAMMGGVVCTGDVKFMSMGTAMTDGRDVWYDPEAIRPLNRKQQRYLTLHENFHKGLFHCTKQYLAIVKQHKELSMIAMDFVVNGTIEDVDPAFEFVERPAAPFPPPLVDPQFKDMSWLQVLRVLLQRQQEQQQGKNLPKDKGQGQGSPGSGKPGKGQPGAPTSVSPGEATTLDDLDLTNLGKHGMDEHVINVELTPEQEKRVEQLINEAIAQGKIMANKLAGKSGTGNPLESKFAKRDTNWKEHLRDFITTIVAGDDNSRFCPPNKRLLAAGFVMPSHFSESTGELVVACDTSGSMAGVYPIVFGEIVRIAEHVRPDAIRILWWDTTVCGEQLFTPKDYDQLAKLMKPAGGGGTTPSVVPAYMKAKQLKPKAVIWLSDGFLGGDVAMVDVPCIWGIVGNEQFVAPQGKKVQITIDVV
jgi:predicted metal-dependent peptidase